MACSIRTSNRNVLYFDPTSSALVLRVDYAIYNSTSFDGN